MIFPLILWTFTSAQMLSVGGAETEQNIALRVHVGASLQ